MSDEVEIAQAHLVFDQQNTEVGRVARTEDGQAFFSAQSQHIDAVIQAVGWRAERHYDLGPDGKCDINDHRPCEMRVAVGMAADICETEGIAMTPGLQRIWDEQYASDTQLKQAMAEWAQTVPPERKDEAENIVWIVSNPAEAMQE